MKLIIDIPEKIRNYINNYTPIGVGYCFPDEIVKIIKNGILIPDNAHAVKHSKPYLEHGEWISEKVDKEDWKGYKRQYYQPISCSKCHSPNYYKSTYCPNCGRRMVELQESEKIRKYE